MAEKKNCLIQLADGSGYHTHRTPEEQVGFLNHKAPDTYTEAVDQYGETVYVRVGLIVSVSDA